MSEPEKKIQNFDAPLQAQGTETFHGAASFPFRHRLLRITWKITWFFLASWTPPFMHRWRIWLVNLFGGQVKYSCFLYSSVQIWYPPYLTMEQGATLGPGVDCYSMEKITMDAYAVVSQGSFLCTGTHEIDRASFQIGARPIRIGANAWIAAQAFIGPGVTVGEGAVLGARAAAFRDLNPWTVYLGNPAQPKRARTPFSREGSAA